MLDFLIDLELLCRNQEYFVPEIDLQCSRADGCEIAEVFVRHQAQNRYAERRRDQIGQHAEKRSENIIVIQRGKTVPARKHRAHEQGELSIEHKKQNHRDDEHSRENLHPVLVQHCMQCLGVEIIAE